MNPLRTHPNTTLALAIALLTLHGCGSSDDGGLGPQTTPTERTEDLPGGGELTFPPGGLPDGTTVTTEAAATPTLPPGVTAIGEAVRIEVDQQLARPAEIRMPIPDGADPEKLVVFQVEDDGTPILLGTRVDGDELVANTPGFGSSSIPRPKKVFLSSAARFVRGVLDDEVEEEPDAPPGLSPPQNAGITGPRFLSKGDLGVYAVAALVLPGVVWNVFGAADVEREVDINIKAVVIRANQESGRIDVTADAVDRKSGVAFFAAFNVSVQPDLPSPDESGALFILLEDVAVAGREAQFGATAYKFNPVERVWDFGDDTGFVTSESSVNHLESGYAIFLDSHEYTAPGTYIVTLVATDHEEDVLEASLVVEVVASTVRVVLNGPRSVAPLTSIRYTAEIKDGAPPWTVTWRKYPGTQETVEVVETRQINHSFTFDQPGTHYVSVTVEQSGSASAAQSQLVTVTGDDPLRATLIFDRTNPVVGLPWNASLNVTGGILVTNGVKKNYTVTLGWGDATENQTLSSGNPGGAGIFGHTYQEPCVGECSYPVFADVTDATGATTRGGPQVTEVFPAEAVSVQPFVLIQQDDGCQFSAAPVTQGDVTVAVDLVNERVEVGVSGTGGGTRSNLSCSSDFSADLVWTANYDNDSGPATGEFSLDGTVASFSANGTISGGGNFFWQDCRDGDGKPTSCPAENPGPFVLSITFTGEVDVISGASSGTIVVDTGLTTTGTWGP